jgi:tetratricopeptide (TPR) repeat protein
MAEDKHIEGDQVRERLQKLVAQWSKGQVTLKQIVGLSDEELYAIASQGYLLFLQGKTESARVIFEGLVACDPKNAYYYRALGAIYWRLKEPQKAIKQLTYAIRVAPRDVSAYVNRAEIYVSQAQWVLAKEDLAAARRHAGPNDAALVNKASAILQRIP